jgi:hypothetical protein
MIYDINHLRLRQSHRIRVTNNPRSPREFTGTLTRVRQGYRSIEVKPDDGSEDIVVVPLNKATVERIFDDPGRQLDAEWGSILTVGSLTSGFKVWEETVVIRHLAGLTPKHDHAEFVKMMSERGEDLQERRKAYPAFDSTFGHHLDEFGVVVLRRQTCQMPDHHGFLPHLKAACERSNREN